MEAILSSCSGIEKIFQDNDINDLETLGELLSNTNELTSLIKSAGLRMKIQKLYRQHTNSTTEQAVSEQINPQVSIDHIGDALHTTVDSLLPGLASTSGTINNSTIAKLTELSDLSFLNDQPGSFQSLDLSVIDLDDYIRSPDAVKDKGRKPMKENEKHLNKENLERIRKEKEEHVRQENAENSRKERELHKTEPPRKKQKYSITDTFDLEKLLEETVIGKSIILMYEKLNELDTVCQSYLSEIIVLHFLNRNVQLHNEDFDQLASIIKNLFPEECKETYYVSPVKLKHSKKTKSGVSKGKLPDKWRNKRTFIRKAHNLLKDLEPESDDDISVDEINERNTAAKSKDWLLHNREPAEDVYKHWDLTYQLRTTDCNSKKYKNFRDILENWPILNSKIGYVLAEKDFAKKFPETDNELLYLFDSFFDATFATFKDRLVQYDERLVSLLQESDNLSEDSRAAIKIKLLASLVTPKATKITYVEKSKKKFWKPTIPESAEGIILHVKTPGDIQNAITEKEDKMYKMGQRVQPYLIVEGPHLSSLNKQYICVDCNTKFEITSVKKGLDALSKLYLAYDIQYPVESEHLWYLLQWGVYKIHTKSDNKIPFVANALNKIKKRQ